MMSNENTPKHGDEVILESGGVVDESRATLAIYGDDLDPDVVSGLLGCSPSRAEEFEDGV